MTDLEGRSAPDAYGVNTGQVEREWSVWDIDYDAPMTPLRAERQRVAATLGEVLRRAFMEHMEACGCGTRIAVDQCPEGLRLCQLRPEGDQVYLAWNRSAALAARRRSRPPMSPLPTALPNRRYPRWTPAPP